MNRADKRATAGQPTLPRTKGKRTSHRSATESPEKAIDCFWCSRESTLRSLAKQTHLYTNTHIIRNLIRFFIGLVREKSIFAADSTSPPDGGRQILSVVLSKTC